MVLDLIFKLGALCIYPVGLVSLLALATVAAIWFNKRRLSLVLAGSMAVIMWLFSSAPVNYLLMHTLETWYPPLETRPPASAIVITCGSKGRLNLAATLFREGWAPCIVLTGGKIGWIQSFEGTESSNQALILEKDWGIPADKIIVEEKARSTHDNARNLVPVFASHGLRREIILVTSAYHLPRAVQTFRKQGFTVHPAPTDFQVGPKFDAKLYCALPGVVFLKSNTNALHELYGLLAYRVMGWV
jgi:uncharacterized SAM-binding protein YcdF (DUF218 family)